MRYTVESENEKREYPTLHYVGSKQYFRGLYELEQHTAAAVKEYFEENDLASMISAEDYAALRKGILQTCLGVQTE